MRRGTIGAALLAAALAGCGGADVGDSVRIGVLEPSPQNRPVAAPTTPLEFRLVASVEDLNLGAMHRGRMLIAVGEAPATGWYRPQLRPRRGGAPAPDGFLEFDFVAAPPELNGGEAGPVGTPAQRRLRAVAPIEPQALAGAVGVRVFADGGSAALRFAPEA